MEHDGPLGKEGVGKPHAADDIDWEEVKHVFIHSGWSQDRIADHFGTTRATVSRRAKQEGWLRLVATEPLPWGAKRRPPSSDQLRRQRIVARLFKVLDHKM